MKNAALFIVGCLFALSNALATPVTVTNAKGEPVRDAHIFFLDRDKKMYVTATTDEKGNAELTSAARGSVAVFCAHPNYCAFRKKAHSPKVALQITLKALEATGSMVCPDGQGEVPGLMGRLCPILDKSNRLYLYADNISLNGGKQQPISFQLDKPIRAEDRDGNRFNLTVLDIVGSTALVQFQKKK